MPSRITGDAQRFYWGNAQRFYWGNAQRFYWGMPRDFSGDCLWLGISSVDLLGMTVDPSDSPEEFLGKFNCSSVDFPLFWPKRCSSFGSPSQTDSSDPLRSNLWNSGRVTWPDPLWRHIQDGVASKMADSSERSDFCSRIWADSGWNTARQVHSSIEITKYWSNLSFRWVSVLERPSLLRNLKTNTANVVPVSDNCSCCQAMLNDWTGSLNDQTGSLQYLFSSFITKFKTCSVDSVSA